MTTFTVTEQEAQLIINAVAERPYVEVANLVQNLLQQAQAQAQAKAAPRVENPDPVLPREPEGE